MKKRMLLSTVLMTLVLLLAATTATFAWYQSTAGSFGLTSQAETGNLSVQNNSVSLGNVTVTVTWQAENTLPKNVNYTDVNGKSYYYAGQVDAAHKLEVADPVKTGEATFTLSLVGDVAELQAVSGTYVITFTASGEVKIANTADAAVKVGAEGSTATHEFTIGTAGTITEGQTGTIHFGFIGKDQVQTGAGGTIKATAVAAKQ